jgi:putative transposase
MIRQLANEYPVSLLCEVLEVPRSTVYYRPQGSKSGDAALLAAIERVLIGRPFYGYRRVTAQLKREGVAVGETRVRRLLSALSHSASVGRARATTDVCRRSFLDS